MYLFGACGAVRDGLLVRRTCISEQSLIGYTWHAVDGMESWLLVRSELLNGTLRWLRDGPSCALLRHGDYGMCGCCRCYLLLSLPLSSMMTVVAWSAHLTSAGTWSWRMCWIRKVEPYSCSLDSCRRIVILACYPRYID